MIYIKGKIIVKKKCIYMLVPSLNTGGAESMATQLAIEINKNKNFNLKFICLSSRNNTKLEMELINSGINPLFLNKRNGICLRTMITLWKIFNKNKPDLVHTHLGACLYTFPWIIFHNTKLIHTIHSTPIKELPILHRFFLKKLYHSMKAIPVAISNSIREQALGVYKINKNTMNIIYNPVDTKKYKHGLYNSNSMLITFICVARLVHVKNHSMLIKAFYNVKQEFKDVLLVLAGDGELKRSLIDDVTRLNLSESIKFLGNVDNVPELLCKSDIFVLSSYYEGLPMTILEAMASGLPIISTNVGGVSDIVKDNGILVESNNVQELTVAMLKLARDYELRINMSKKSMEYSIEYDISNIAQKYEQLYEDYSNNV